MDPASIGAATFALRDAGSNVVPATVTYEAGAFRARLHPSSPLAYSATYTATVTGGPDGVRAARRPAAGRRLRLVVHHGARLPRMKAPAGRS